MYDLDEAMARDTTGQLESLLLQFTSATDVGTREDLMHQIIQTRALSEDVYEEAGQRTAASYSFRSWGADSSTRSSGASSASSATISSAASSEALLGGASRISVGFAPAAEAVVASAGGGGAPPPSGTAGILTGSRGPYVDAHEMAVLERFFGQMFTGTSGSNPSAQAAIWLNESYRQLFELWYAELMAQSHLKDLYDKISVTVTEVNGRERPKPDFSAVIAELQATLVNDPDQGKELLSEFARSLRGAHHSWLNDEYLSVRETFIQ